MVAWICISPLPAVFIMEDFPENLCRALLRNTGPKRHLCALLPSPQREAGQGSLVMPISSSDSREMGSCIFYYDLVAYVFSLVTGRKRKRYCPQLIAFLGQNTLQRHFSLKCILAEKNPYYWFLNPLFLATQMNEFHIIEYSPLSISTCKSGMQN